MEMSLSTCVPHFLTTRFHGEAAHPARDQQVFIKCLLCAKQSPGALACGAHVLGCLYVRSYEEEAE